MNDLNQVLDLIKAGNKTQARQLLLDLLRADRDNEQAWLYMAACATSKHEFEMSLQQVLKLNPLNSQAIQLAEKQGIPLPAATKAALKQAKKGGRRKKQAPAKGTPKSGRRGLRILLLLLVVIAAAAGAGYAILNQGENKTATVEPLGTEAVGAATTEEANPQATAAATSEATEEIAVVSTEALVPAVTEEIAPAATEEISPASTTEPSLEPTFTPTKTAPPKPTLTRTPSPTATLEASPTLKAVAQLPTATETPAPTLTPTSEFNFPLVEPNLQLVYTIETAYLKNTSQANLDISGLRFVQRLATQEISFAALEWQFDTYQGLGSVYALQPGRCFQVGTEDTPASIKPKDCVTLNAWKVRDLDGQFWLLNDGNIRTFLVLQNETPIAECPIEAGTCEFGLPPQ